MGVTKNERARTVASAGPSDKTINRSSYSLLLQYRLHRRFSVDEAVAVELAVAAPNDVEELPTEREAIEVAEEARAAREEPARGDQHAAAEQVGGIAACGAAGAGNVRLIAIDAERQQVSAAERSRLKRQVELLPLPRDSRRVRGQRERGRHVERSQAF